MTKKRRSRQFKKNSRVIDINEARNQRFEKRQHDRDKETFEHTESDERRLKRKRAMRKKKSRQRLLIVAVTVVLIIVLSASVINIIKLKNEQSDALKKQEQLKTEQQQLEKELKSINDEKNIEDKAREKLKLIKPGETIYVPDEEDM